MNKKNLMLDRRQALGLGAGMFGAAALATLPDWGPTPIATEQQAKTS